MLSGTLFQSSLQLLLQWEVQSAWTPAKAGISQCTWATSRRTGCLVLAKLHGADEHHLWPTPVAAGRWSSGEPRLAAAAAAGELEGKGRFKRGTLQTRDASRPDAWRMGTLHGGLTSAGTCRGSSRVLLFLCLASLHEVLGCLSCWVGCVGSHAINFTPGL